ncbi:hypothetical protein INT45_013966 [Circinella minor]|uniref:Uncharacterized protein n=1 Tax=Circinella minor TaxID=1195481 RepID=A0A8H7VBM4_9FUNG|nr:hypothetical protein INT45_013966 [Circinella minor]
MVREENSTLQNLLKESLTQLKKEINKVKEEIYEVQEAMESMEDGINKQLYDTLGESVLKQEWKSVYLMAFKKNGTPFPDVLAMNIRTTYDLNVTMTWCDLLKTQQLQANLLLEEHIKDQFPLRACAGYWGARLLMVRAF